MWRFSFVFVLAACDAGPSTNDPRPDAGAAADGGAPADAGALPDGAVAAVGTPIAATPQKSGDPARGYDILLNAPYVRCGIPDSLVTRVGADRVGQAVGGPSSAYSLPGRSEANEGLPYYLTRAQAAEGAAVVNTNCLGCHASPFGGQVVVGLGNSLIDTTGDLAAFARVAGALVTDEAEHAAWADWSERMVAVGDSIRVDTVGVTAADNLAVVLFGRRDPVTFNWQADMAFEVPDDLPVVPLAPPPWWRMKKKNAMFYTGGFQGDHSRFMYAASMLCLDDVSEIAQLDVWFADVRAYIDSVVAPAWPYGVDAELAATGEGVFNTTCARCHGTYGPTGTYPNLVIPLAEVGTDGELDRLTAMLAEPVGGWVAQTVWADTNAFLYTGGYMAPPLDGLWITAPFLHNDSVPDLASLLDSRLRPTYWRRSSDPDAYVPETMGFAYETLAEGKAADRTGHTYDTTRDGYRNTGHVYGDALTPAARQALMEYLKTL